MGLSWCPSLSSRSVGYISETKLSNIPTIIYRKEISNKTLCSVGMSSFDFVWKIRDEIYSSSFEEGRRFAPGEPGAILIEIPTDSCICNASHFKVAIFDQMIYSNFEWCSTILGWPSSFLTLKCCVICWRFIKFLFSPLNTKSMIEESLCFSFSWGKFLYKVEKS